MRSCLQFTAGKNKHNQVRPVCRGEVLSPGSPNPDGPKKHCKRTKRSSQAAGAVHKSQVAVDLRACIAYWDVPRKHEELHDNPVQSIVCGKGHPSQELLQDKVCMHIIIHYCNPLVVQTLNSLAGWLMCPRLQAILAPTHLDGTGSLAQRWRCSLLPAASAGLESACNCII